MFIVDGKHEPDHFSGQVLRSVVLEAEILISRKDNVGEGVHRPLRRFFPVGFVPLDPVAPAHQIDLLAREEFPEPRKVPGVVRVYDQLLGKDPHARQVRDREHRDLAPYIQRLRVPVPGKIVHIDIDEIPHLRDLARDGAVPVGERVEAPGKEGHRQPGVHIRASDLRKIAGRLMDRQVPVQGIFVFCLSHIEQNAPCDRDDRFPDNTRSRSAVQVAEEIISDVERRILRDDLPVAVHSLGEHAGQTAADPEGLFLCLLRP